MKPENKCRLIFIVAVVILLVGTEVTGIQKEAQYAFLGLTIYFLLMGVVFGLIWCTRTLSRRHNAKQLRRKMREMACLLDLATNTAVDVIIKAVLKKADEQGILWEVAKTAGIAGGADELRKVMNTTGELHLMDRAMIGMHIGKVIERLKECPEKNT